MIGRWKWSFSTAILLIVLSPVLVMSEPLDHDLSDSIEQARGATVGILRATGEQGEEASPGHFSIRGSGFHLRDGYIVTARHAVERQEGSNTVIPEEIAVLTEKFEEVPARLIGVNTFLDLTLYRVNYQDSTLSLSNVSFSEEKVEQGHEVFTVGYPLGRGPALGFGRLGNLNTFLPTAQTRLMQIDLSACSGNSGGGVFNDKGEVVGMVQSIVQTESNQGERQCSRFAFAVPGHLVQRIVTALIDGSHPGFPRIGIGMTAAKIGNRWRVAVSKASGPAKRGGIRKGDILLSIDDTDIISAAQLKNYLIERKVPGQQVTIRVLRGEEEQLISVTLGKV